MTTLINASHNDIERYIRAILYKRSVHSSLHDDIVQDIYSKLLLNKYNGSIPFFKWLSIVTNSTITDVLRKESNRIRHTQKYLEEKQQQEDQYEDSELINTIRGLIPNHYHNLYDLWLSNNSHKEIADKLKIPEGTVKSRLFSMKEVIRGTTKHLW